MLTIHNQTRAGKIFKCTIFVGYGGVIFFTGVAPHPAAMYIVELALERLPCK